ncbi:MAG: hypothetical protein DI626_02345 [Micavibrio aeruginosavorus]|uniref:Uncharacterized protein n=1 Tax=Micavibrio aeruginosavorus TaxID=349221 RepID=A0A2W5A0T1_9BACT|nr:MAG: hypothetical protein DI626_02345 [Micavibrio aeruginosavorus]PZP56360.1 MAG: hypothetical protein DI586_03915 [Micavibrio aeruginosavorus]
MLFLGGVIASWFVAPDANKFHFISFVAAMLLFVVFVALAAFWPVIWARIKIMLNVNRPS